MASRTAELIAKLTDQVSGPAKGMTGALKGTTAALDALKAKAGKLDAFKQASKALDDASQKFKLAQQNVRRIRAEMDAAGDGGKKLAAGLRAAEREAEAAKNAFKSQGQEVRAMRAALAEAGVPLNRLAAYERQLRSEIERTTTALQRQKRAAHDVVGGGGSRRMEALAKRAAAAHGGGRGGLEAVPGAAVLSRFGAGAIGGVGGAVGAGLVLRRAAQSSMTFERSMIEVGKATDTSGADLDVYAEKLMRLARQTGKTKEELASMLSQAGFAGRPKQELMDFTEYSAKAMVAWGTSAEDTGQALAEIGNIYEADQGRIEQIGDAINTMADNSASRETDLLEFMRRAGASSKQAGISAEHMLAFGASLKEVGVRTDVAATGFEALLNVMKLGGEFSKKAGEGLKALGIDSTKMRKAFVAKPVETMVGLLEKLNNVADPLKKAEIMTNLFGKEYQDDIAKLLNALPKVVQYLALMSDKAKIAAGGVRFQFGQNIDKDVSKIDRATQAIDTLLKNLGDPIKLRLGNAAQALNEAAERFDDSLNVFQRWRAEQDAYRKAKGLPEDKSLAAPTREGDDLMAPMRRAHLDFQDWLYGRQGKAEEDAAAAAKAGRERAEAEAEAVRRAILDGPGDIERKIRRQREAQDQSRREAAGSSGLRRSTALDQVGRSDAEIKRLEGELARAWEAIGELRARDKRERGAFGIGGPGGKDPGGIGPGRFGFGLHGTDAYAARNVPLPPARPKMDTAEIEAGGKVLDEVKAKGEALDGLNISIPVDVPGAGTAIQQLQTIKNLTAEVKAGLSGIGSGAISAGTSIGRTAAVTSAIQNSPKTV